MLGDGKKENRTVYILFFAALAVAAVMVVWTLSFGRGVGERRPGERAVPTAVPEDWTIVGAEDGRMAVAFYTAFASVEVRAGEEVIYRYADDGRMPFGKTIPAAWHIVGIPAVEDGTPLSLTADSPYRESAGVLSRVWAGDEAELIEYLMRKYIPRMLVCGVFLTLGAAVFISSFPLKKMTEDVCTIRCFGIFVALASCWMMSEVELPITMWSYVFGRYLIRYLFSMLCPAAFLMYLLHRFPERYQRVFRGLLCLMTADFFAVVCLQLLGIADFRETAWMTHGCMAVIAAAVLVMIGCRFRRKEDAGIYLCLECAGIVALAAGMAGEVSLFYRHEYLQAGDYMQIGLMAYIACMFTALMLDIRRRWAEAGREAEELQDSRIRLMVSQIKPHFIYNTLSSIRTLIKTDPDRAYDLVYDFSRYLRSNIDSIDQQGLIPFAKEVEHIRVYCGIENVRFGDKLAVIYEIGEDQFEIPPLTVQPLVENAIKHGIRKKPGPGIVKIRSSREGDCYVVEVLDNGVGFDTEKEPAEASMGLKNIRLRLQALAGAGLTVTSIPGKGTQAVLRVPAAGENGKGEKEHEDHRGR